MIWSATKIIIFIALISVVTWFGGWLTEADGGVQIVLGNTEYQLGALQAAIALVVLVVLIWMLVKIAGLLAAFLRFANGDETAVSRFFDRRSRERGFEALSEGLIALSSGDGKLALAKAAKADRHLRRPELTNLISAQAAELTGDVSRAEEVYRRLLGDERTKFVGIRGLMKQKLQAGDTTTALKLAEKAFAIKPSHGETGDVLLQLQAAEEDWIGARKTLTEKARSGALPREVHRRRDAALAVQEARETFRHGTQREAGEIAIEANRLSPDLVPAAVLAAQAYITDGRPKYAARVLRKAWTSQPHPDLAAAYASIVPDEDPKSRLKRFRAFLKIDPSHVESQLLEAELQIAAGDFEAARKALGDLPQTAPTTRNLALLAAIERAEGGEDTLVRALLTKAITASRGPQWVCENCNKVHGQWNPICDSCEAFDTIQWATPQDDTDFSSEEARLVPLLVSRAAPEDDFEAEAEGEIPADGDAQPDPTEQDIAEIDQDAEPQIKD